MSPTEWDKPGQNPGKGEQGGQKKQEGAKGGRPAKQEPGPERQQGQPDETKIERKEMDEPEEGEKEDVA